MRETQSDLVSAAHLREAFRYVAVVSDLELREEGGYIALITHEEDRGGNYIVGVGEDPPNYLPLLNHFKKRDIPFAWFSYPHTSALESQLRAQGLSPIAPLTNVVCDLKQSLPQQIKQSNLSFVSVTTAALFKIWCEINATVWNRSLVLTKRFYRGLCTAFNQESRMQLFLIQHGTDYAGCSLIDIQGDVAGCYWDCVLSDYRKQGIGLQMVYQRQDIAKSLGCSLIVAQCLDTSLGLYLKAGFAKGAPLALYRY